MTETVVSEVVDFVQTGWMIAFTYWLWTIQKKQSAAEKLISAETIRKQAHTKAFEKLTDVKTIEAEMEASASASELRAANRLAQVRENAGPHARVWKPKLRGGGARKS